MYKYKTITFKKEVEAFLKYKVGGLGFKEYLYNILMYISCFKCDKIYYGRRSRNLTKKRFCDTCDKEPVIPPVISPVISPVRPDIFDEFMKVYELTNDEKDYILSSELVEWVKDKCITITKLGRDINKYSKNNNLNNILSKAKKINGKTSQVWTGIKLRK
jgi:hypothetical protein